jgi:hypothetical protein
MRIYHKILNSDYKMQIKGEKWDISFQKKKMKNLYLSVYQSNHFNQ